MTTEGEKRPNNKVLVGILSGLILVIIGLVVGIVVMRGVKPSDDSGSEIGGSDLDLEDHEVSLASKVYTEAFDILSNGDQDSYDKAMECFDKAISSTEDPDVIFALNLRRISLLIEYKYLNNALLYTEELDSDSLDISDKYNILMYYGTIYKELGDSERIDEYEKKLQEIKKERDLQMYYEQGGE